MLTLPQIAFATVAALRGSLSLVMIADYIIKSDFYTGSPVGRLAERLGAVRRPCACVGACVGACVHTCVGACMHACQKGEWLGRLASAWCGSGCYLQFHQVLGGWVGGTRVQRCLTCWVALGKLV